MKSGKAGYMSCRASVMIYAVMLFLYVLLAAGCGAADKGSADASETIVDDTSDTKDIEVEGNHEASDSSGAVVTDHTVESKDIINVDPVYDAESTVAISIDNPTWEAYAAEGAETAGSLIQIDEISEDRYDWLDSEKWVRDNGYTKTGLPYTDGDYYYEAYAPSEYDYMYQKLAIYLGTDDSGPLAYDFDLSLLCNGPDEKAQKASNEGQYIRFAAINDGVLYVSTSHLGYSYNEPDSSYVSAIDLSTFSLLWKSCPLVCNSENFVISGDALICGYGFTDEPDYIYALDIGDGSIVKQVPVRTAPYVFVLDGSVLHVATYNTDYTFAISFG